MIKLIFIMMFLFSACSRQESAPPSIPAPAEPHTENESVTVNPSGNMPPEVMSAMIIPDRPYAITTLDVNFSGRDPENDFINYHFRWYVDNQIAQDGSSGALSPGKYWKGSVVYVEVTPSDARSTGKAFRTEAVIILNSPPVVSDISLSPQEVRSGMVVNAAPKASDADGDEIKYLYQWHVNGKAVSEPQESNEYNTKGLKKNDMVAVIVTPSDRDASGTPVGSQVVTLSNSAPQITSTPKYDIINGLYSYQVTAKDPDGDRLSYNLAVAPTGMTINSSGLVQWKVPAQVSGRQDVPIRIEADDGDGGKAVQEFSITLEMK